MGTADYCHKKEPHMKVDARVLCLAMALAVSGCTGELYGQKETGGAISGAALGGIAGSLIGSGRNSTASISRNAAVQAPMARASERRAATEVTGFLRS